MDKSAAKNKKKRVSFAMVWQEWGCKEIDLPETVDGYDINSVINCGVKPTRLRVG